jgi:hypothetical protein
MTHNELANICRRFRGTSRSMLLRWGLARTVVALLALLAALVVTDYFAHFAVGGRSLSLLAVLLGVAGLVYFELIRPLKKAWTDHEILSYLDRAMPGSEDSLVSLAELSSQSDAVAEARSEGGRKILDAALADLHDFPEKVRLGGVFRMQGLYRWQILAALITLAFVAGAGARPDLFRIGMARLFMPYNQNIKWPHDTYIELVQPDGDVTIAQNASFTVKANVTGVVPSEVTLVYTSADTGREVREVMKINSKGECAFTFPEVVEPLRFFVEGGDDRTGDIAIKVLPRPSITQITAAYNFPSYSGVPPKRIDSGQISGLEGTQVSVKFSVSKQIEKAAVTFGDGKTRALDVDASKKSFSMDVVLEHDDTYSIQFEDADGLGAARAEKYTIRVTPDQPPTVRMMEPSKDLTLTAQGHPRVSFTVSDDFGLTEVGFFYRIGEKGAPVALSDRITGPVRQSGKDSPVVFTWELSKLEGLVAPAFITFFVRAKDCNPSGKGVCESSPMRIDLLTPLEFQTKIVLDAKRAILESRLSEQKQRWAIYDSLKWLSGAEKDAQKADDLAGQILTEQEDSSRASRALDKLLQALRDEVKSNQMERDFFGRRLDQISEMVRKLVDTQIPAVEKALDAAKPKSNDESLPEPRRKKLRDCLTGLAPKQKLAAASSREILGRLLDWADLQGVLVQTQHLEKEQKDIHFLTETKTRAFVGKEVEDLPDADARFLEQLAKRQMGLCEGEGALEEELQKLIADASREKRAEIAQPLFTTFKGLKDNLISNLLRRSGELIANNKTQMVLADQLKVAKAMNFINQGLERAGNEVKPPLTDDAAVKMALAPDERLKQEAAALADNKDTAKGDELDGIMKTAVIIPEEMKLETVERYVQDLGDSMTALLERTAYMNKRVSAQMPDRYRKLRLGWLMERHALCLNAVKRAQQLAAAHDFKPLAGYLGVLCREVEDAGKQLSAGEVAMHAQIIQTALVDSTRELRRFLGSRKQTQLLQADREKAAGKDEFGRDYVLAGTDLPHAIRMTEELGWARVLEADLVYNCRHLAPGKSAAAPLSELARESSLKDLADADAKADDILKCAEAAVASAAKISAREDARKDIGEKVVKLLPLDLIKTQNEAIKTRRPDGQPMERAKALCGQLQQALAALNDLIDARVKAEVKVADEKPPEIVPAGDLTDTAKMTPEKLVELRDQFLKDRKPAAICKRIEENQSIPEPVRKRLLATLQKGALDPKYEMLLSAYFLEITGREK